MATVKLLDWKQVESRINDQPVQRLRLHLLIDGIEKSLYVDPPYSRAKAIQVVRDYIATRKEDVGMEFTI